MTKIKAKGHEDGILLEINGQQVIIALVEYQQKYDPIRYVENGWVECVKIIKNES